MILLKNKANNMTKLSIIIPCYNCEKTLKEAFDSCFTQNISEQEFEIIMVDDGSSDKTRVLMMTLASSKTNVKTFFHDKNRGGGAARNTGIKQSSGTFIFCLDSDNILADNTFPKMIAHAEQFNLDGVAIHDRRFFSNNINNFKSSFNTVLDREIKLEDLFNDTRTLLDNFLYTRASYNKTKGYPEHHGFDTQCFEVRYLSSDNKVRVCKDTVFFHRQAASVASYYEREYSSGNFSKNYYLIFEEIIPLLSDEAVLVLLNFEIFTKWSTKENLLGEIFRLEKNSLLFKKTNVVRKSTEAMAFEKIINSLLSNDYQATIDQIKMFSNNTTETQTLWYARIRAESGLTGTNSDIVVLKKYPPQKAGSILKKIYRHPLILPIFGIPIFSRIIDFYIKWKTSR